MLDSGQTTRVLDAPLSIRVLNCAKPGKAQTRVRRLLKNEADCLIESARNGTEPLWNHLDRYTGDVILLDRSLIPKPPEESLDQLLTAPEAPQIVVFGSEGDPGAKARFVAIGCLAYVDTSIDDDVLAAALGELVRRVREERLKEQLLQRSIDSPRLSDFVTRSPTMQAFMAVVERIVGSDTTLLVTGETGVGKERLARAIHEASPRSDGPFVAVNCGALPEALLESELFGHTEGSFTGATRARRGWFELAHRGVIFLDEIGEMPHHLQVKILRVLQDTSVTSVGAERPVEIDVRIMAATNRDLKDEVAAGRFRDDLFYRLSVVTLEVPPLRDRREDIPGLVDSYVRYFQARLPTRVRGFSADALAVIEHYSWPGNVRELINTVERCLLLSTGTTIQPDELPLPLQKTTEVLPKVAAAIAGTTPKSDEEFVSRPFREVRSEIVAVLEKEYFGALLRVSGGRIGEAAKRAGMTARNLFEKLRKHGLDKAQFKY